MMMGECVPKLTAEANNHDACNGLFLPAEFYNIFMW